MKKAYPILEFDPERQAMVEPALLIKRQDVPQHCVLCFFKEVIEKVVNEHKARIAVDNHWEDGPHPVYEITYKDQRLAFFHPGVGSALAAGLLEEAIAFGCSKFIACGGCGILEKDMPVGHLIVVSAAVRDEGVSYHYLPPGREVIANAHAIAALQRTLERQGVPNRTGKTWTTDAPYRETREKVADRKRQGCLTVEMEAAAMMAVAEFRGVIFGQVLYAGDDLSGSEWSGRRWQSRREIREQLFWLAAEACLAL
jgi:uridine phosphorylase